ncbi:outer membrane beta-barrel domain-containing protein [bacterium]|jgi:outer membrane beta-barrel protein|nr:outer membrane beta-barrel domain-containing protein [bacterium]
MKTLNPTTITATIALLAGLVSTAAAEDTRKLKDVPAAPAEANATGTEKVDVNAIKDKYWARGDESKLEVVQNRLYSKAKKFEIEPMASIIVTDPFLDDRSLALMLAYHLDEYISVGLLARKDFTVPSATSKDFQSRTSGGYPNINSPTAYYGAEITGSLLYGKLSVVGKAIIYYDMHLIGGAGLTQTVATATDGQQFYNNNITAHVGIGQKIFLSKTVAFRFDYRVFIYGEKLYQLNGVNIGQDLGSRTNFSNALSLGFSFFLGGGGEPKK